MRSTEDVQFTDVLTVELPRREVEWCREPSQEELAGMGPQKQRIAELEAELCQREAVITDLKRRLQDAGE